MCHKYSNTFLQHGMYPAIGHWGNKRPEVPVTNLAELQALEAYLRLAYEAGNFTAA